jgi:hypothetical protein
MKNVSHESGRENQNAFYVQKILSGDRVAYDMI